MKENTTYEIVKKLRAAGHAVEIKDAPKPPAPYKSTVEYDDLAVVGGAGMGKKDVDACVEACRKAVRRTCDGYAVAVGEQCRKQFPGAAFAVW